MMSFFDIDEVMKNGFLIGAVNTSHVMKYLSVPIAMFYLYIYLINILSSFSE